MNELSLFSGAGGGVWASKLLGHRLVGYVEKNQYCQQIIRQRIRDGVFDDAPIFEDVRTFNGAPYRGRVDIVTAGFPCQPFSYAGKREGVDDERNGWPDTVRILFDVRPPLAFLENVPGLLSGSHGYFGAILSDLAECGFNVRWTVLGASDVGGHHIRKRVWILAYTNDERRWKATVSAWRQNQAVARNDGETQHVADSSSFRCEAVRTENKNEWQTRRDARQCGWWASEPQVDRVAHGVAARKHRLSALGNGQVPLVAATAFKYLMGRVSA